MRLNLLFSEVAGISNMIKKFHEVIIVISCLYNHQTSRLANSYTTAKAAVLLAER